MTVFALQGSEATAVSPSHRSNPLWEPVLQHTSGKHDGQPDMPSDEEEIADIEEMTLQSPSEEVMQAATEADLQNVDLNVHITHINDQVDMLSISYLLPGKEA